MQPRLLVMEGPARGWILYLDADETPVGRGDERLLARDYLLSRRHCLIVRDGRGFSVKDLGSKNGTFVNGRRVAEQRLEEWDAIQVGHSKFIFLLHGRDETAESSRGHVRLIDRGYAPAGALDTTQSM